MFVILALRQGMLCPANSSNSVMDYIIPEHTRVGHVHLKVADLERSLEFYRDLLGFQVMQYYGSSAVFISAGGYHHHIGLNTWYSKNGSPPPPRSTGLFHTAILYPTRKDLVWGFQFGMPCNRSTLNSP